MSLKKSLFGIGVLAIISIPALGQSVSDSTKTSIVFKKSLETKPAQVLQIEKNTLPERLPVFCAMEHKVRKSTGLWLKLRLQESGCK